MFLKEILFKSKHLPALPKVKESPSPRKKKKKLATGIEAGIEFKDQQQQQQDQQQQQSKKKKKIKQIKLVTNSNDTNLTSMSPLDVTVPGVNSTENIEPQISSGLLTTSNLFCYHFFYFSHLLLN